MQIHKLIIITLLVLPFSTQANKSSTIEIKIVKQDFHTKTKKRQFFFTLDGEEKLSGKMRENKVIKDVYGPMYEVIVKKMIKSPIIKKYKTKDLPKNCMQKTVFELIINDKYKKISICESPRKLTKEDEIILNWSNHFFNF